MTTTPTDTLFEEATGLVNTGEAWWPYTVQMVQGYTAENLLRLTAKAHGTSEDFNIVIDDSFAVVQFSEVWVKICGIDRTTLTTGPAQVDVARQASWEDHSIAVMQPYGVLAATRSSEHRAGYKAISTASDVELLTVLLRRSMAVDQVLETTWRSQDDDYYSYARQFGVRYDDPEQERLPYVRQVHVHARKRRERTRSGSLRDLTAPIRQLPSQTVFSQNKGIAGQRSARPRARLPALARCLVHSAVLNPVLLRTSMDPGRAYEDVKDGASSIDATDLAAWFEAKRRFREAGYRMVSQTMLQASLSVDNSSFRHKWSYTNRTIRTPTICRRRTIHYAWSTPMLALPCSSPRFTFYKVPRGRVFFSGSIPFEDFSGILPDAIPSLSLALKMNKDQLKLQSDAIGIVLSYLQEERRVLKEKHAAWATSSSRLIETLPYRQIPSSSGSG
ncbi:hypothetical protein C8Q76DRAFT_688611 [Earliella scabrosa]|nr:hypothetical protein C8Q76DRAFT_688611 [Earliella scabrosa]